ncbi:glutathione S-transferase T3-like [Mercurialis annua]|uniref:glutathione S-transferase T3-like n=1 Tax=Mercurialis annua TaxID=3986 RepID=UPI0021605209|nr:glutathione S-transferase T3-like [Mercurialis annua]XP_050236332.1 glutathione S-transferase T3-like [Mercurialis annua]
MNFQSFIDDNRNINLNLNSEFSTQQSNSDDISIFTNNSDFGFSIPPETNSTNSKRQRSCNFTVEEDLHIVSSWLNISIDAIQGNEQKHRTYWTRLWEYFHKYRRFESERTHISLMNRWSTIQLATNKFCGCYAQIESRNQSGINEQDKIANAKILFQELNKGKFQFEHCWNILRFKPKWLEDCEKKKPTKKKDKIHVNAPASETGFTLGDDNITGTNFIDLERPPGRKVEKEKKKRKNKEMENDSSDSYMNILQEMREEKKQFNEKKLDIFEKVYVQGQERLLYEKEKMRLEQLKEDERIMGIDTTGMPEMLANFYIRCQSEIIERKSRNF